MPSRLLIFTLLSVLICAPLATGQEGAKKVLLEVKAFDGKRSPDSLRWKEITPRKGPVYKRPGKVSTRIVIRERSWGLSEELDSRFHCLVLDRADPTLSLPTDRAVVIGLDKALFGAVGASKDRKPEGDELPIAEGMPKLNLEGLNKKERKDLLNALMDQKERTFVSHIMARKNGGWVPLYDGFTNKLMEGEDGVQRGYSALTRDLGRHLRAVANSTDAPTHFIVMATGWQTNQQESIRDYRAMITGLKKAAATMRMKKGSFDPYYVLLTWPAEWEKKIRNLGGLASLRVKGNDADEIGFLWANFLLHEVLRPISNKSGRSIPVVAIGHSLGARILTRAAFSRRIIFSKKPLRPVDLVIGLQPAFSQKRFDPSKAKKAEGAAFREPAMGPQVLVMTSTLRDLAERATGALKGSKDHDFVGGKGGWNKLRKSRDDLVLAAVAPGGEHIIVRDQKGKERVPNQSDRFLLVDATRVIGGHSDVWRPEHGRFLLEMIQLHCGNKNAGLRSK